MTDKILDNSLWAALFDPNLGGRPRAFECKLCPDIKNGKVHSRTVTLSLRGMRRHQKVIHGFVPQKEMFNGELGQATTGGNRAGT